MIYENLQQVGSPDDFLVNGIVRSRDRGSIIGDSFALLIPCSLFVEFNLVGRLFLPEILLLALLPILLIMRGHLLATRLPLIAFSLGLLWLSSQIATDFIRDTPFEDYSRGWSKITFMLGNFASLYLLLYGSRKRLVLFALGLIIGSLLAFFFHPIEYAESDPWKFGVGIPLTLLTVLLAQIPLLARIRLLPGMMLCGMGALSLILQSRSLAGLTFMTGIYLLLQAVLARRSVQRRPFLGRWMSIVAPLALGISAVAIVQLYDYLASTGLLGVGAEEKYIEQSATDLGILFGGRAEILVSSQAIIDSPVIGHGSWAKDPYYVAMLFDLARYGYNYDASADLEGLIPTHSHLFGAWVEAGFLGIFFWLWVLALAAKVLLRLYRRWEPMTPLIAFTAFTLLWDIPFSPFGAERRITVPFSIIILIFATAVLATNNAHRERTIPPAIS